MQPSTVSYYQELVTRFEQWMQSENLQSCQAGTRDILDFLGWLQNQKMSESTQRLMLTALRHYFNYLIANDPSCRRQAPLFNPASGLYLKNRKRTVPVTALPLDMLHRLYEEYPVTDLKTLRDKVTTGLLVYQGIAAQELTSITIKNLNLKEGRLQVPDGHRINGRVLKLEGSQILYLQRYIKQRGLSNPNDPLLPKIKFANNYYKQLAARLRKIAPELKNIPHIRQSVMQYWSGQYDIRLVQYMAGHKWVSSTQRYDMGSLETLKAEIDQLHPLNQFG
ncbi:integrase/recombinase XerD [Dyadobacter jejuensis]|uniref:Integrase/recombinase XerD n=2 Tax=Dyadobacter jejuensis TaxID=1082580 RepID=A0A316A795_9BACT|nr:integrase/recombinase XerD [Dyadobacter jejuensis]